MTMILRMTLMMVMIIVRVMTMTLMMFQSPGLREQGSSPEQMDSGFPNSRLMMIMM